MKATARASATVADLQASFRQVKLSLAKGATINYVKATARAPATAADLPGVARQIKLTLAKKGHAAQFNRVRSSLQRYLRDTLGRRHRLYEALDVEPLAETNLRKNNPQSVAQIMELARTIAAEHFGALWRMALTGMGPSEFFDGWKIAHAGVYIPGTKRKARDRPVPLALERSIHRCERSEQSRTRMEDASLRGSARHCKRWQGSAIRPSSNLATWMEEAQIPRTRRRQYMGHSTGDVTDTYEPTKSTDT